VYAPGNKYASRSLSRRSVSIGGVSNVSQEKLRETLRVEGAGGGEKTEKS